MKHMKLFAQITKVDEAKREVWGRMAHETPDNAEEIFDYDSSKPHFEKWSGDIAKTTDSKSLGNVRAMHGNVAAGKVIAIDFDDTNKTIDIGTKCVDDNEWKKCLEGVYTGFSIGGKYLKKWEDAADKSLTRYTARPSEVSYVDKPCIPTATFFDIVKADGTTAKGAFKTLTDEQAVDELAKLLTEGTVKPQDVLAALHKAKDEEDDDNADDEDDEDDGLVKPEDVSQEDWDAMTPSERQDAVDADAEKVAKGASGTAPGTTAPVDTEKRPKSPEKGDSEALQKAAATLQGVALAVAGGGTVPEGLSKWFTDGVELCKTLTETQTSEVQAAGVAAVNKLASDAIVRTTVNDPNLKLSDIPALAEKHLVKAEIDALGANPTPAELLVSLVAKYGARHSQTDLAHLQTAHDHLCKAGAKCAIENKGSSDTVPISMKSDAGALLKLTLDAAALQKLEQTVATLVAKVKKYEDEPMPPKGVLRVVSKGQDKDGPGTDEEVIKSTPGQHNPDAALALIKQQVHQNGALRKY